jgi:hypothetical protein
MGDAGLRRVNIAQGIGDLILRSNHLTIHKKHYRNQIARANKAAAAAPLGIPGNAVDIAGNLQKN